MANARPTPQCPIRADTPCSLCVPGATGPQDCGLVYLVMSDPELQTRRTEARRAARERPRAGC
jgi:hypothetical protein